MIVNINMLTGNCQKLGDLYIEVNKKYHKLAKQKLSSFKYSFTLNKRPPV